MRRIQGQALLEFIIIFAAVAAGLLQAIMILNSALKQRHEANAQARAEIFQVLPNESWQQLPKDHFSRNVEPFLHASNYIASLPLPIHDSRAVHVELSKLRLARLTEAWQVATSEELITRPSKLSLSHQLNRLGVGQVLNVIGYLPMAKELRSDFLELGKVDANITPFELKCVDAACR